MARLRYHGRQQAEDLFDSLPIALSVGALGVQVITAARVSAFWDDLEQKPEFC